MSFLIVELKNPSAEVREAVLSMVDNFKWQREKIWPSLILLLKDKEARIRRASAVMLEPMQKPETLCHLGVALSDEDAEVRKAAAKTLKELQYLKLPSTSLGKDGERRVIIAAIVRGLKDPDDQIRTQAAAVLKQIGSETVPELLAGLKKEDVEGRLQAAKLIVSFGKTPKEALPFFVSGSHSDNLPLRAISLDALSKSLPDSLPALKAFMADKNVDLRRATAESLQKSLVGKDALDILLDALEDSDEQVRKSAAGAVGQIGNVAAPSVIKLAFESKKLESRLAALTVLGSIRQPGKEVFQAVVKLSEDPVPEVRAAAVKAKAKFSVVNPVNRVPLAILIGTIEKGSDGLGRREAINSLAAYGSSASPALKTLVFLVRSRDSNDVPLRTDAAVALTRIDIEESHAAILALLSDEDSRVQAAVAGALEAESAGVAKEALLKLLSSPNLQVRSASARALSKIGPAILSEVEPLLADKEGDIRTAALQAVANFEPAANLGKLLLDDKLSVRELAASTLAKKGSEAVPILIEALRFRDYRAQTAVADAIGPIEDRRDDLVPALVDILLAKGSQELELRSAAKAIRRVNPILGARILADKAQVPGLVALLNKRFSDVDELACLALAECNAPAEDAVALVAAILKRPDAEANVLAAATRALTAVGPAQGAGKLDPEVIARIVKGTHEKSAGLREEMMISLQAQSTGLGGDAAATVLSALALGQVTEEVDQWIIRQAKGTTTSDAASPNLVRLLALFHGGNKRFQGRLSPAAEQSLKDHFWSFLQDHGAEILPRPEADVKTALLKFDLPWMTFRISGSGCFERRCQIQGPTNQGANGRRTLQGLDCVVACLGQGTGAGRIVE